MTWSKESRQSRGYGAAWDRIRKIALERDKGLCQVCASKGRPTPATEVDHIISKAKAKTMGWSKARMDDPSNLQSICKPCHLIKTEQEQGKKRCLKVAIGADGWPVTPHE